MPDQPHVLVPTEPTLFFGIAAAVAIAFVIAALVTLWNVRSRVPSSDLYLWLAAILIAPLLGSLAWLTFGRRWATSRGVAAGRAA